MHILVKYEIFSSEISRIFVFHFSLEGTIRLSMQELSALLSGVKGTGQVSMNQVSQRNEIMAEADHVLHPLMDILDGKLSMFYQVCERTVLKRLLKVS